MGLFIYRFFVPRAVQAEVLLWSDSGVVLLRALDEGWALLPCFFFPLLLRGVAMVHGAGLAGEAGSGRLTGCGVRGGNAGYCPPRSLCADCCFLRQSGTVCMERCGAKRNGAECRE